MASTGGNNIQLNVNVVNNQLTRYTVDMGTTLAGLTKAMQATTDRIIGVEKTLAQEQQALKREINGIKKEQQDIKKVKSTGNNEIQNQSASTKGMHQNNSKEIMNKTISAREMETKSTEEDSLFRSMLDSLKSIRKKISAAFTPLSKIIQGAQKKWSEFSAFVGAKAKAMFKPLADGFNALFGTALKNGFTALGNALLSAVAGTRQMQQAIAHLKEGFAQMVAPIASAVAPALSMLTNAFATVLAYAGRLFSFLTGKAVKGANNTAAAVSNVGKAAGGTAKKTQEATRSLAGFDEITRLDAPKASAYGGGSGGGSAVPAAAEPAWEASSPFLDRVLATIQNGDWEQAGHMLAEKMDSLLKSWDAYGFGQKLGTGVNHALELLAGFIQGGPWESGEQAMAEGIGRLGAQNQWNTLGAKFAQGFNGIVEKLDPAALASVVFAKANILVRSIGSFLENLDYQTLAQKVSAFVGTAFENLSSSIASVDWGKVGEGIASFFKNLDWVEMAQSLGGLLGAMFQGALAFFTGLLAEPFAFLKEKFLEGFHSVFGEGQVWEDEGQQLVTGLLLGIVNALAGIAGWIWDNIFQPICQGFCDAFGIHSPSTVAAEWGGFIIEGLLSGLGNAWQAVEGFLGRIAQGFAEAWNGIRNATAQVFQAIAGTLSGIWAGITGSVRAAVGVLVGAVGTAWDTMKNGAARAFNGLAAIVGNAWDGVKNLIRGAVNGIIGFLNSLISGVGGGINAIASGFNSLRVEVPAWVPGIGGHTLGFNIPAIRLPQIPYLAQGAVIPANREFLAVLGDQTSGTNIEAPLATIEQAVANVMDRNADLLAAAAEYIVAAIERKQADVYIGDDAIGRAAARYQRRQAVMRGGVY